MTKVKKRKNKEVIDGSSDEQELIKNVTNLQSRDSEFAERKLLEHSKRAEPKHERHRPCGDDPLTLRGESNNLLQDSLSFLVQSATSLEDNWGEIVIGMNKGGSITILSV